MDAIWGYRDDVGDGAGADLVGYDVEATDGHIGKIDESSMETDQSHVVVDTGFWIFGKKRLIPAGVITDVRDRKVYVNMTKDQIKDAPDWNADWSTDETSRTSYSDYYTPYGW